MKSTPIRKAHTRRRRVWNRSHLRRDALAALRRGLAHLEASPSPRKLLQELRAGGISLTALAVTLGASPDTLNQWRNGSRNPSATARRCIWLLHRLWFGDPPASFSDWYRWTPTRMPPKE